MTNDRSVRVGIVILPEHPHAEASTRWKALQDLGFAHGWTYDHLAWRDLADGPWYSTITTLTAAACATDRLRLGTWVASPNFRHPVTFAKDLMSLDEISGGRLIAGLGAGGTGWDAEVLGDPPLTAGERFQRFRDWVHLLDELLRTGDLTAEHGQYTAVRARTIPAGSRSRMPFVLAGGGPRAVRLALRYDGWATYGLPSKQQTDAEWWQGLAALSALADDIDPQRRRPRYLSADGPVFSLTSVDRFEQVCGQAADLGFTDVVAHWPRAASPYAGREAVLHQVADRLHEGTLRC